MASPEMAADAIRVATWNVNSVRKRCDQAIEWLESSGTDVLCLQETKCVDEQFPLEPFEEIGYECHIHGQKAYNGVAIISRAPVEEVSRGIPGYDDPSCRVISGSVGGARIVSAYVPNGQRKGTEKFGYKMEWLGRFTGWLGDLVDGGEPLLVVGDYNIAPAAIDLYDEQHWGYDILTTPQERGAFSGLIDLGMQDVFRTLNPGENGFTWWDYRKGSFASNKGIRIDLALATAPVMARVTDCFADEGPRGNESPSDHTPVVVVLGPS